MFFNRAASDVAASRVVIDDYKWAFFAVEHLINIRREMGQPMPRIMHFQGPSEIDLSGLRYRGYADALRKHGLPVDSSLVIRCESITREEGLRMMNRCIVQGMVPDALFGFNDQLAIGAMKALKRKGFHIPQEVSVMGFTESQSALVTEPMLSSVAQPLDKMGETAARLLLEKIQDPASENRTVVLEGLLTFGVRATPRCSTASSSVVSFHLRNAPFRERFRKIKPFPKPFPLIYCRRRPPKKVYSEYICFCKALAGPSDRNINLNQPI